MLTVGENKKQTRWETKALTLGFDNEKRYINNKRVSVKNNIFIFRYLVSFTKTPFCGSMPVGCNKCHITEYKQFPNIKYN